MTVYNMLRKAICEGAHTIEVKERGSDKKGGVANLNTNGDVSVFYGADDGNDDTVVTPEVFSERFEITDIIFN